MRKFTSFADSDEKIYKNCGPVVIAVYDIVQHKNHAAIHINSLYK